MSSLFIASYFVMVKCLTDNHQQLLLLFDDVDLKDGPQARDVSQRVLDNVQGVQTLFRAHQNYLRHSKETQSLT